MSQGHYGAIQPVHETVESRFTFTTDDEVEEFAVGRASDLLEHERGMISTQDDRGFGANFPTDSSDPACAGKLEAHGAQPDQFGPITLQESLEKSGYPPAVKGQVDDLDVAVFQVAGDGAKAKVGDANDRVKSTHSIRHGQQKNTHEIPPTDAKSQCLDSTLFAIVFDRNKTNGRHQVVGFAKEWNISINDKARRDNRALSWEGHEKESCV